MIFRFCKPKIFKHSKQWNFLRIVGFYVSKNVLQNKTCMSRSLCIHYLMQLYSICRQHLCPLNCFSCMEHSLIIVKIVSYLLKTLYFLSIHTPIHTFLRNITKMIHQFAVQFHSHRPFWRALIATAQALRWLTSQDWRHISNTDINKL